VHYFEIAHLPATNYGTMPHMNKLIKQYRLPKALLDDFERLPMNRSAAMSKAVLLADKDPSRLEAAAMRRAQHLLKPQSDSTSVKVSVTVDPKVVEALERLRILTRLPIEHVLKLAMEAYIT